MTVLDPRRLTELMEILLDQLPDGQGRPYRYRDPARVTPQRAAELKTIDAREIDSARCVPGRPRNDGRCGRCLYLITCCTCGYTGG